MLHDYDQAKVFTPISVSYDKGVELPFPEADITVEPQTQRVSPPVHDVIIPFATELDFAFKYSVNGKEYKITVDLFSMAYQFNEGHRIAVVITSSNYDRYALNTNTGEELGQPYTESVVATNQVITGPGKSCIYFPELN